MPISFSLSVDPGIKSVTVWVKATTANMPIPIMAKMHNGDRTKSKTVATIIDMLLKVPKPKTANLDGLALVALITNSAAFVREIIRSGLQTAKRYGDLEHMPKVANVK